MSRLIDANNIKEAKFNNVPYVKTTPTDSKLESYMRGWNDAIDVIAECEPTADAVEVIRCKDCKNVHFDTLAHEYWCNGKKVMPNHYCGYAERRQDDREM